MHLPQENHGRVKVVCLQSQWEPPSAAIERKRRTYGRGTGCNYALSPCIILLVFRNGIQYGVVEH